MKRKRLLAAGGDLRQLAAAVSLAEDFTVSLTGLVPPDGVPEGITQVPETAADTLRADLLLLPMPATKDGVHVNTPLSDEMLRIDRLTALLPAGAPVLGGRMEPALCDTLRAAGLVPRDYARSESFAVRNAIPTAEGALEIAMRELPVTLWGLPVLLLGAGRISQAMQPRLRALGAEVTVAARRFPDHARTKGDKRKRGEPPLALCLRAHNAPSPNCAPSRRCSTHTDVRGF